MKKLFLVFATCSILVSGFTGFAYYRYRSSLYTVNVNGESNTMTTEDIANICKEKALQDINLTCNDKTVTLKSEDFADVKVDFEKQSFLGYVFGKELKTICNWTFDKDTLVSLLDNLQVEPTDAFITMQDDGKFVIIPETYGYAFNTYDVADIIMDSLRDFSYDIDLNQVCYKPEVTEISLEDKFKEVKWVNDFYIKYTDGTSLSAFDIKDYWSEFELDLTEATFDNVINALEKSYDTKESSKEFKTSLGTTVNSNYVTYGIYLDKSTEINFIKEAIYKKEPIKDRVPETNGYDDLNGTYIEISIGKQHVWHYVDGKLCCDSDCVTGRKGSHDTPLGIFYVSEMIPGKYLRGRDYVTWVNRWMRLTNSGYGLHDAYWRGSFGSNIYKYNGSHGCVNLPPKYARNLYDEISRGIPVIIYYE